MTATSPHNLYLLISTVLPRDEELVQLFIDYDPALAEAGPEQIEAMRRFENLSRSDRLRFLATRFADKRDLLLKALTALHPLETEANRYLAFLDEDVRARMDPVTLKRLLGGDDPVLDCDRGEQWKQMLASAKAAGHQVLLLGGPQSEAHDFFLDRIEQALPREVPRRILRVTWPLSEAEPSVAPYPKVKRFFLASLARALRPGTTEEDLPRLLREHLRHQRLFILHPRIDRGLELETGAGDKNPLLSYYQSWLPVALGDEPTLYPCKVVQPIAWDGESVLQRVLGGVQRIIGKRSSRAEAQDFMETLVKDNSEWMPIARIDDLKPLTEKDVLKFLELINYPKNQSEPRKALAERQRLVTQVFSGGLHSERILRELCRLLNLREEN